MTKHEYMELPYSIVVTKMHDESGTYYYSKVLELDGCQSDGDTFEEAYNNVLEAMEGYIETKLENGFSVPVPKSDDEYSGKFVIRIPKSLHRHLAAEAEHEGVSLNQYAMYKLSM